MEEKTVETVDLSRFETGVAELMQKLKFPPAPNGQEMPPQQKQMMIIQFMNIAMMN